MAPLWGWAPRGQRIKAKVPHGALLGLGDFLLKIIIFGRLSVAFHNAMPAIPSTTRTAPATINQCGYSIAESIGHFLRLQLSSTAGGLAAASAPGSARSDLINRAHKVPCSTEPPSFEGLG
jgi:hypothetical protein